MELLGPTIEACASFIAKHGVPRSPKRARNSVLAFKKALHAEFFSAKSPIVRPAFIEINS
jgi:hypothetical protein